MRHVTVWTKLYDRTTGVGDAMAKGMSWEALISISKSMSMPMLSNGNEAGAEVSSLAVFEAGSSADHCLRMIQFDAQRQGRLKKTQVDRTEKVNLWVRGWQMRFQHSAALMYIDVDTDKDVGMGRKMKRVEHCTCTKG